MAQPLPDLATRIAYASRQMPRMAWYAGHLQLMRWLRQQVWHQEGESAQSKPRSDPRVDERLNARPQERRARQGAVAIDLHHIVTVPFNALAAQPNLIFDGSF